MLKRPFANSMATNGAGLFFELAGAKQSLWRPNLCMVRFSAHASHVPFLTCAQYLHTNLGQVHLVVAAGVGPGNGVVGQETGTAILNGPEVGHGIVIALDRPFDEDREVECVDFRVTAGHLVGVREALDVPDRTKARL